MRKFLVTAVSTCVVLGAAAVAPIASADQVWHQSIGRPSASAACSTSSSDDLAAGWSGWGATWEQWVNGGRGGFTCTRSITWAVDAPAQFTECTFIGHEAYAFISNDPGFLPTATPVFDDAACANNVAAVDNPPYGYVFTSRGQQVATEACRNANSAGLLEAVWDVGNLYFCAAPPG